MSFESPNNNIFIKNYDIPKGMSLENLDHIEISTQNGKLEFRLRMKKGIAGSWNATEAYEPKEQLAAINELIKIFGKDKVASNNN